MTIRKIIRTSQPQTPCGIDWSNPVTRGLTVANTGNSRLNLVDGKPELISTSYPSSPNKSGICLNQTTDTAPRYWKTKPTGSNGLTIFCVTDAQVKGAAAFVYGGYFSSSTGEGFSLSQYNGGLLAATVFPSSLEITKPLKSDASGMTTCALVRRGTSLTMKTWLNGVFTTSTDNGGSFVGLDTAGFFEVLTGVTPANQGARSNLLLTFDRALSDAEIKSLSDNPWQIFQPLSQPIYTNNQDIILPSKGYPTKDLSKGLWTGFSENNINSTLSDKIDEDTPDTSDYIYTDYPTTSEYELSETQFPGAGGYQLSYNASGATSAVITVKLRQGMTEIAQWQHPLTVADTTYTQTLTPEQVALVVAGPVIVNLDVN